MTTDDSFGSYKLDVNRNTSKEALSGILGTIQGSLPQARQIELQTQANQAMEQAAQA